MLAWDEAVPAKDGTVRARLERNLGGFAAGRANGRKRLTLGSREARERSGSDATVLSSLVGGAALLAAAGFVIETLLRVKLLFAHGERKSPPTVPTGDGFVS